MRSIKAIFARQILNAKGNPTIETTVVLDDGAVGIASFPSGTSVGKYEAIELMDEHSDEYGRRNVSKAIENVKTIISPKLSDQDASKQQNIDSILIELDGTKQKSRLGANATLSVSIAVSKAAASSLHIPLYKHIARLCGNETIQIPRPTFNLINGGKHAINKLDFQEFLAIPLSNVFSDNLNIALSIYKTLFAMFEKRGLSTLVGDEGGFGPDTLTNTIAIDTLIAAIKESNFSYPEQVQIGIDAASNSFYDFSEKTYRFKEINHSFFKEALLQYYQNLLTKTPLLYLEDPFYEDDFQSFATLTSTITTDTMVIGDDLTVTNSNRLQEAINKKAITGIIVKPNQIGTISETLQLVNLAKQEKIKTIVSHRSGETNDDFIADFAVGVSSDFVKFGAPARGERIAKYNRLLQIEKELRE